MNACARAFRAPVVKLGRASHASGPTHASFALRPPKHRFSLKAAADGQNVVLDPPPSPVTEWPERGESIDWDHEWLEHQKQQRHMQSAAAGIADGIASEWNPRPVSLPAAEQASTSQRSTSQQRLGAATLNSAVASKSLCKQARSNRQRRLQGPRRAATAATVPGTTAEVEEPGIVARYRARLHSLVGDPDNGDGRQLRAADLRQLCLLVQAEAQLQQALTQQPGDAPAAAVEAIAKLAAQARKAVLEGTKGLAVALARQFAAFGDREGIDYEDFLAEALAALERSILQYDPAKAEFSTFAHISIRTALQNLANRQHGGVRIPANVMQLRRQAARIRRQMAEAGADPPSAAAVAHRLGVSVQRLREVEDVDCQHALEVVVNNGAAGEEKQAERVVPELTEEGEALWDDMAESVLGQDLEDLLMVLTRQEHLVLSLRFGLGGRPSQTQEAIGKLLKCSKSKVLSLERSGVDKLRRSNRFQELLAYTT